MKSIIWRQLGRLLGGSFPKLRPNKIIINRNHHSLKKNQLQQFKTNLHDSWQKPFLTTINTCIECKFSIVRPWTAFQGCSPKVARFLISDIFFDKGQKKSIFINEIGHLIKNCMEDHFKRKLNIPEYILGALTPLIKNLFESVRELFHFYPRNGKNTSRFTLFLTRYCPLPSNYKELKKRVAEFVVDRQERS